MMDPYELVSHKLAEEIGNVYVKMVQRSPKLFGVVYALGGMVRRVPGKSPVYYANIAVAKKLNRPFKAETVDFDSVIPAVISGKADLAAAGITVTEDRKKNVDFSIPYVKTGIVVIYKKSNPFKNIEQLKGKKIGVQGGTTSETFVLEQLKQEPERSKSPAEAVAALKSGRVEFVIADIDPAKNCVKGEADLALSDFITSEEYAVAIRKGQPELLKAIDETIAELKASGQLDQWIRQFTEESDKLKDK